MIKYLKRVFVRTQEKKTHAEASLTARRQLIGVAVLLLVAVLFFSLVFDSQPRGAENADSSIVTEEAVRPVAKLDATMLETEVIDAPQVQQLSLIKDLFVVEGAADNTKQPPKVVTTATKPQQSSAEELRLAPVKLEQQQAKKTDEQSAQAKRQAEQTAQAKRQAEQAAQAKRQAEQMAQAKRQAEQAAQAKRQAEQAAQAKRKAEQAAQAKRQAELDANAKRAYAILNADNTKVAPKLMVQVGAYTDPGRAKEVQQQVKQQGVTAFLQNVTTDNGVVTRVRVGPFNSKEQAQAVVNKLAKAGYKASLLTQ